MAQKNILQTIVISNYSKQPLSLSPTPLGPLFGDPSAALPCDPRAAAKLVTLGRPLTYRRSDGVNMSPKEGDK